MTIEQTIAEAVESRIAPRIAQIENLVRADQGKRMLNHNYHFFATRQIILKNACIYQK